MGGERFGGRWQSRHGLGCFCQSKKLSGRIFFLSKYIPTFGINKKSRRDFHILFLLRRER